MSEVISRRRQWRQRWITRFAERQRTAQRWVSCVDIIEWCSHSTTTAGHAEEDRAGDLAWQRLARAIASGEFEHGGRSKVLYLDPHVSEDGGSPRRRLTRAQFEIAAEQAAYMNKTLRDWRRRDLPPDPPPPLNVLRQCWLPRELARQWIEKHGYRWPAHFEIRGPPTPLTSMAKPADAPPTQSTNPAEAKHNEAMAANGQSNKKRRGGRHPGSGQRDDEEALRGMLALLAAGKAASVYAAAKIVVSEGKPAHSAEAEIHRLRKKFSGRWGNEPPPGKIWADVGHE